MKNISIIGKFLTVMAAFGAFSVAVAVYAGFQISRIDEGYSELLDRETAAATNTIRMNRSLQSARASIAEIIMSKTDELTQAAEDDLASNRKDFETSADLALAEVNTAVNQMDQVTQQNAAMVEESNAASTSLAGEAGKLKGLVGQFQLPTHGASRVFDVVDAVSQPRNAETSPVRRLAGRVSAAFGATAAMKSSWEEF